MTPTTLPCLVAVHDEIDQRCRALCTYATLDGIKIEQPDKWTVRFDVTCADGQHFHVDLDLLDLMIEGRFCRRAD